MFSSVKNGAKNNLRGNIFRSFAVAASPLLSLLLFVLSSVSSLYLLVIDTQLFARLGVFTNTAIHMAACIILILENSALFFIYIYAKLYSKNYFIFYSVEKISFYDTAKATVLYTVIFFRKLFYLIIFVLPAFVFICIFLEIIKRGVISALSALFVVCSFILLIAGIFAYKCFSQKYYLADVFLYINEKKSVIQAIKQSAAKMNGKCRRTALLDICYFYMKLLSLFLLPAIYFLPRLKAMKAFCVLEKEIPYINKRQHTEKTVVFYFKPAE